MHGTDTEYIFLIKCWCILNNEANQILLLINMYNKTKVPWKLVLVEIPKTEKIFSMQFKNVLFFRVFVSSSRYIWFSDPFL